MSFQPDESVRLDALNGLLLVDNRVVSANILGTRIDDLLALGLRVDQLRWQLACHILLHRGGSLATLQFQVRRGKFTLDVPTGHRLVCDHVVLGDRWIPIDEVSVVTARECIGHCDKLMRMSTANAMIAMTRLLEAGIDVSLIDADGPSEAAESPHNEWQSFFLHGTSLFPYQEKGVKWLSQRYEAGMGALLADEMGLGKTIQAIAWVAADQSHGRQTLIVTPASLTENWRRELIRFAGIDAFPYVGPNLSTSAAELAKEGVVLTTYDSARVHQLILEQIHWATVIADEAQYIKNPESGRSISIKALPRDKSLAITGTPLENRLSEFVSILDFVAPNVFEPLRYMNDLHLDKTWAITVRPFLPSLMLRREVLQVRKDLPPKIDIPTPLVPSHRYSQRQEALIDAAADADYSGKLALLTQLRQLSGEEPLETSGKGEFLETIFSNLKDGEGKALFFASFNSSIESLSRFARAQGLHHWIITGSTPPSERQSTVDTFADFSGPALLILNPKAGGVGLNITAANVVVHLEPDWNPAVTDQATARSFRTGQTKTVFVYYTYYVNGIEEYIVDRQMQKRELAAEAVQSTEEPLSSGEIDKLFNWLSRGSSVCG